MSSLTVLDQLEEEAIYVFREVAGQFERAAILFSGGKDSVTLAHLARKAFAPMRSPFPLLHVDTGHNFQETIEFRDRFSAEIGAELVVRLVQTSIDLGRAQEEQGPNPSRNSIQSVTLMDAIKELKLDCAIGGARRDEEKARAKERFFSHRSSSGRWEPRHQRPEVWNHYNGAKAPGEHFRVFPLSNWTELDVWNYLHREEVALPSLYFAHEREVFERDGVIYAKTPFLSPPEGVTVTKEFVRFRTVGDATCTGAVRSRAATVEQVMGEIRSSRISERATRGDDRRSESAMEDRKREGYF
jgi:sulfate adenylyltransferase subunit 2